MEAQVLDCTVEVYVKWRCPNCGTINENKFTSSPYRIPIDEIPEDERCTNCKEFFDPRC